MTRTFFARRALLLLLVVFFCLPLMLRGARLGVSQMKNDVKDWLPDSFTETKQLDWFRQHFLGEQFVVVSWPGCTGQDDDDVFKLFLAKLAPQTPPDDVAQTDRPFIGDRLGLYFADEDYRNWGGLDEKWLRGSGDSWYYITPAGNLYQWHGSDVPLAAAARNIWRTFAAGDVRGTHVASLGDVNGPWYYANPRRLNSRYFKSITTGPGVLQSMIREGGALAGDRQEALSRLEGSLFGPDGKQTCVVLTLTDTARQDLHRVLGRGMLGRPRGMLPTIADECSIKAEDFHLGGPPVDNVAIDEEGTITLVRLVGLCALLGLGISYVCLRSVLLTLMVFFVGGTSAVLAMALVWWCGSRVDAVLMSMPALVYVLGLSSAIHIVNYYRDAVREHGRRGAPERAVAHGWVPCTLCAVTTALGMLSLYSSQIEPIRKFGLFSALGVMATLVILFVYLPSALQVFPPREALRRRREHRERRREIPTQTVPPWSERFWQWYARGLVRHHRLVVAVCLLVTVALAYGTTRINTSVQILKMFDPGAKIITDYAWLETHLGKLVPMEVVIKIPSRLVRQPADSATSASIGTATSTSEQIVQLTFLDRLEAVAHAQRAIERAFGDEGQQLAGRSVSAVTFAPALPATAGDTLTFARRGATNRRLEAHRDEFEQSDYLRVDGLDNAELWRISVRLAALQDVDYGQFVDELTRVVEPVMAAYYQREVILRGILERRGQRLAGARVLIVGATRDETDRSTASQVNATNLFAGTLADVLRVARVRVDTYHPPATRAIPSPDQLAAYDCVVLANDDPACDGTQMAETARWFVDARESIRLPAETRDLGDADAERLTAVYTGVVPLVYKAQRTLLKNLVESTIGSFLMVGICMVVLLTPGRTLWSRLHPGNLGIGLAAGAISMLPNMFPVLVVFGAMGWSGVLVDIGSMMTASVALGIAVDDTIHFLTWFRWGLNQGLTRQDAIVEAYKRCATAMCQTTMIGGLGMFIFATSSFTPTQRFGVLMLSLLSAALVGDLVFGPALYASPLGYFFRPTCKEGPIDSPPVNQSDLDVAPDRIAVAFGGRSHCAPVERGSFRVNEPRKAPTN